MFDLHPHKNESVGNEGLRRRLRARGVTLSLSVQIQWRTLVVLSIMGGFPGDELGIWSER